jgi:hypothetical protein
MAVELQIESSTLSDITTRALQTQLNTTCFPDFGPAYVDHANVVFGPLSPTASAGAVQLHVPVDIFIVLRTAVLAAPNGVPAGATSPAGRVTLQLELRATGAAVSLTCVDVDLGSLGAALGPAAAAAKTAIIAAAGSPVSVDLSATFTAIGLPQPGNFSCRHRRQRDRDPFRSGRRPGQPPFPGSRLGPVRRWTGRRTPGAIESAREFPHACTGVAVDSLLASLRHLSACGRGLRRESPCARSVHVRGQRHVSVCDFGLTPGMAYRLRTTVNWSLHLDLGDFTPGFIENWAENFIVALVDPSRFGGVPLGPRAFAMDSVLPPIKLGGSDFLYTGVLGSPAGMTIGGPVKLPLMPSLETVKLSATAFSLPSRLQFCSQLAKTGSGDPIKSITIKDVKTNARIFLEDAGNFCAFEVISPGAWINAYIFGPPPETPGNTHDFSISVPGGVSGSIKAPARLIVRTARGVRLADLGVPPKITVDANGQVTNAIDTYIDDCLYIDPNNYGLKWGHDDLVIPKEHPDWLTLATSGLDVQLVTLNGLDRGELVQFRSAHHQIDVTADQNGRAMMPVLLPLTSSGASAQLTRTSRQSIAGLAGVQSAIFGAHATVATAPGQTLSAGFGDSARLTSQFGDRTEMREIDTLGVSALDNRSLNSAMPVAAMHSAGTTQTKTTPAGERDPCEDLPGFTTLLPIPGFDDAPIAIALLKDGTALVMDLANRRSPRVAGTFNGPIGAVQTAGNWALTCAGHVTSIYRVSRSPEDDRSCCKYSCTSHE